MTQGGTYEETDELVLVLAVVGLLAGAAFAQFAKTEDAIKYRQSVMSLIGSITAAWVRS